MRPTLSHSAQAGWPRLAGLVLGLCADQPGLAGAAPAVTHLQSAQKLAQATPTLQRAFKQWCSAKPTNLPADVAEQRLQAAETSHQTERAQARPDADRLRTAVLLRACAAHQASLLQPGRVRPVWLHTAVDITELRPGPSGVEVRAKATSPQGPVVNSRITFARGLHHSYFALSNARGEVQCTLVDTHPHAGRVGGWDAAHDGPVVATLAGSMTSTVVELPAVALRELPTFASRAFFVDRSPR